MTYYVRHNYIRLLLIRMTSFSIPYYQEVQPRNMHILLLHSKGTPMLHLQILLLDGLSAISSASTMPHLLV